MNVELISKSIGVGRYKDLSNGEIIAAIARHGTIKEDNGKLVRYLMDHKHWSPLQHVNFGFLIETRRSISAQIFRHRSLHGQEWSLRYAEPLGFEPIELRREHPINRQSSSEEIEFSEDDLIKLSDSAYGAGSYLEPKQAINSVLRQIQELYEGLISLGVARECARDILPLCTMTTVHITGSLRDLLGFMNVRCDDHAQKEIRDIATRIGEELEKELPDVFSKIDWRNGMFM